jgi:NAD(P)-dependent dehydrogenase (short-subunit alcohol dehydrogenase family)
MEKKIVIVTGASKGIGRAIAERLSLKEMVILTGRNRAELDLVESPRQYDGDFSLYEIYASRYD